MTAPYHGCPHSAQSWFAGSDRTMRCSECEEAESAWASKLAAAEERARKLEEALRNAVEMIHDASGPLEYARANDWMRGQLLALATPQQPATAEELA